MRRAGIGSLTGVLLALAAGGVGAQEVREDFPARLAAVFPEGFEINIEVPMVHGGRTEFNDVMVKAPGELRATVGSMRPRDGGRMVARRIEVSGGPAPRVTVSRGETDLAGLGVVLAAVHGVGDTLGNLCSPGSANKIGVRLQDISVSAPGAGLEAGEMDWRVAVSRGAACEIEVNLDVHNLARTDSEHMRLDVRGGSLTGRFQRNRRTGIVEWRLEGVNLSRGGKRAVSVTRFSGRAVVDRLWMERVTGVAILGGMPDVPEVLDPQADNEFMDMRGVAVHADRVLGSALGAMYRLATGRDTVDFGARLWRNRDKGGAHLFRVQMFSSALGDVTGAMRVGVVPEIGIESFDLLFRDLGISHVAGRMESSLGDILRARGRALGRAGDGQEMADGVGMVFASVDNFLQEAREHRMQASFRPARSMSVEALKEIVRRHPERFGVLTGMIYGRHDGR